MSRTWGKNAGLAVVADTWWKREAAKRSVQTEDKKNAVGHRIGDLLVVG